MTYACLHKRPNAYNFRGPVDMRYDVVNCSRSTRPSGTTNEEKMALSIDRRGRVQKKKLKTQQTYPWPDDDTRFLDLRTISGFTPKLSSFYGTRSASLPILTD